MVLNFLLVRSEISLLTLLNHCMEADGYPKAGRILREHMERRFLCEFTRVGRKKVPSDHNSPKFAALECLFPPTTAAEISSLLLPHTLPGE